MTYLSIDLEATGLNEKDHIIEFAAFPFNPYSFRTDIPKNLIFHHPIWCPSFKELESGLDPWIIKNNKKLIENANSNGLKNKEFRDSFESYLNQKELQDLFKREDGEKILLFGKSMAALDLPFLNRDLGWDFMRKYFSHRHHDLSSVVMGFIDAKVLPADCIKGSVLSKYLLNIDVAHNALDDAINCANMYSKLILKLQNITLN